MASLIREKQTRITQKLRSAQAFALTMFLTIVLVSAPPNSSALGAQYGTIEGEVSWTKQGGPYILDDTVVIAKNSTLTIEAGAEVYALSGAPAFNIEGNLKVDGNAANPVKIASAGYLFNIGQENRDVRIDVRFATIDGLNSGALLHSPSRYIGKTGNIFTMYDSDVANFAIHSSISDLSVTLERNVFLNSAGLSFEPFAMSGVKVNVVNNLFSGIRTSCGSSYQLQFSEPIVGQIKLNSFLAGASTAGTSKGLRIWDWKLRSRGVLDLKSNYWAELNGVRHVTQYKTNLIDASEALESPHAQTPGNLRYPAPVLPVGVRAGKAKLLPQVSESRYSYYWEGVNLKVTVTPNPKTPDFRFEKGTAMWLRPTGIPSISKNKYDFATIFDWSKVADLYVLSDGLCLAPVSIPKSFGTCKEVKVFFRWGIGRNGAKNIGRPIADFNVYDEAYAASKKLDLDKDGIICE